MKTWLIAFSGDINKLPAIKKFKNNLKLFDNARSNSYGLFVIFRILFFIFSSTHHQSPLWSYRNAMRYDFSVNSSSEQLYSYIKKPNNFVLDVINNFDCFLFM